MAKTLFFDFDGTIADSEEGITNGIKYMIKEMGLHPLQPAQYRDWVGPSLSYSMHKYFPGMDVTRGIKSYQDYYNQQGIFELKLYPGVTRDLQQLKRDGYKLAVASSKPEHMIQRIVKHLDLTDLFAGEFGASPDERTRVTKTDVLAYALQETGANKAESVMIGDRFTDMEGGRNNAVKTLGVTYGFGDRAELQKAGASLIVDTPDEVRSAVGALI
ncbi:HAD hydrolase-like protein [Lacticaseibacillus zhaodongensis]|uniref:HAD hydrolase-like protein n=1 Tax=Lacticaseibacillus zhaodongensis TaxID=2668065 RepID=UPI0012D36F5E|nr:HAD hydrolase-like protein [Lacticaseibacillus zhaodongensis]